MQVLNKCVSIVFADDSDADESEEYEYYVANGRGICICDGEFIKIEGIEERIPWTLQAYIKFSSSKYASRTRLYCVKKFIAGKTLTARDHLLKVH